MIGRRIAQSKFAASRVGQAVFHALAPNRTWVFLFVVAIVSVNVWTLTIQRAQAHDEAIHAADIAANHAREIANAESQYRSCLGSVPVLKKINGFIQGNKIIRDTLVANARANVSTTAIDDPQYDTRVANLHRLEMARAESFQVQFPVPTAATCMALRNRLLKKA